MATGFRIICHLSETSRMCSLTLSSSPLDLVKHFLLKNLILYLRPQLMTLTPTLKSNITIYMPSLEAS
jgi:hypothetical protein